MNRLTLVAEAKKFQCVIENGELVRSVQLAF